MASPWHVYLSYETSSTTHISQCGPEKEPTKARLRVCPTGVTMWYREVAFGPKLKQVFFHRNYLSPLQSHEQTLRVSGEAKCELPLADANGYPGSWPHITGAFSSEGLRSHRRSRCSYPRHTQNPVQRLSCGSVSQHLSVLLS